MRMWLYNSTTYQKWNKLNCDIICKLDGQKKNAQQLSKTTMEKSNLIRVKLFKRRTSGLGFLVRQRKTKPYALVSDLVVGGCADQSGLVSVGDVILRINDIDVSAMRYESIVDILKSIPEESHLVLLLRGSDHTHLETRFTADGVAQTKRVIKPRDTATADTNGNTNGSPKIVVHSVSSDGLHGSTGANATADASVTDATPRTNGGNVQILQDQDQITVYVDHGGQRATSPSRDKRGKSPTRRARSRSPGSPAKSSASPSRQIGSNTSTPKRYQKLRYLENEKQNLNDTLHTKVIEVRSRGHSCTPRSSR